VRISSEIIHCCDADAFSPAEGSIRQRPLLRGRAGVAGVPSPGHVSKGIAQEPKRAPHLLPHQEECLLHREVRNPEGRPEGSRRDGEQSYNPIIPVKVGNRRACAVTLAIVPAGENPVGGDYPVATVVIPGSGEGDRSAESPEVKVSVREASNSAGRSKGEPVSPEIVRRRECRTIWEPLVKASAVAKELGVCSDRLPGDSGGDMLGRNEQRKRRTTRGSPRRSRTAKASHIKRSTPKLRCACE
jgi:hypothetical protein